MILGYALLMMGPLIGGLIAFGIVVGSLFRGVYLLNDIHKRLGAGAPEQDRAQEAYEEYVKEREKTISMNKYN